MGKKGVRSYILEMFTAYLANKCNKLYTKVKNISDQTVCSIFVTVDKSSSANVSFVKIVSVTSYCI